MSFTRLFIIATTLFAFSEPASAISRGGSKQSLEPNHGPHGIQPTDANTAEFEEYKNRFSRNYAHGSEEYWLRRGLFEQRSAAVKTHNAKEDRLWEAVAGPFADFTEDERTRMRGYRHLSSQSPSAGGTAFPAAARELLRPSRADSYPTDLPAKFDWLHLKTAKLVPDQAQCGSCWAVTSKSVLDAHHEIYVSAPAGQPLRNFSAQQIVTCVPNPRSCGGTGGCAGSTVELAFDWVLHNGLADEHAVPYEGKDLTAATGRCNESKVLSMPSQGGLYGEGTPHSPSHDVIATPALGGTAFGMHGYHMLERNKEEPLIMALYQHGPVATSTSAGAWFEYSSGIFNDCPKDTIVDHAVTLYGFGEAEKTHQPVMPVLAKGISTNIAPSLEHGKTKYWLIRNSWGKSWGEQGFIRMERLGREVDETKDCGEDTDNAQGTGCKGDPQKVEVCGMCGFLYDSVIPHFNKTALSGSNHPDKSTGSFMEMEHTGKFVRRES